MADELPDSGGWEEWRRLVLSEQRRLGHDLRELTTSVRGLASAGDVADLAKRLGAVELQLEAAEDRIATYRKTIVAVSLTLFASIAFPILRAWATAKGGAG